MRSLAFIYSYLAPSSNYHGSAQDDYQSTRSVIKHVTVLLRAVSKKEAYDPVLDWTPPSPEKVRQLRERVLQPMKSLTSSVFYSTDNQGNRHEGLDHIPPHNRRPLLFVSNHQLIGLDSWLIVNELQEQCNIFARSLTHPFLYPTDSPDGTSFLETYGCLPVSTRNF